MIDKKKIVGKPFEKGKSGNPSGRPKGALANTDVVAGIIEGLKKATKKKDGISAITAAINDDIAHRIISKSEAVALIAKFMPKDFGLTPETAHTLAELVKLAGEKKSDGR